MTVQVLRSRSEIITARKELHRRGLSCTSAWPLKAFRQLGLVKGINVGDYIKSWDVLNTATFIERSVSQSAPILDIGGYGSEILCVLHRLNYSALTGVDLNPKIKLMPYDNTIRYEVSDFMRLPFDDESFEVITAISVIEHGFENQELLFHVSRLLRPGGHFIASFDYWPDKVDTTGVYIFGMNWRILSRVEVLGLLDDAEEFNLIPCGAVNLEAREKTVKWGRRRYTFAWLALEKRAISDRAQT